MAGAYLFISFAIFGGLFLNIDLHQFFIFSFLSFSFCISDCNTTEIDFHACGNVGTK